MTGQITSHNNIGWSQSHTDAYNNFIKASNDYAKEAADVDRVKAKASNCEETYKGFNNMASKASSAWSEKNRSIDSLEKQIKDIDDNLKTQQGAGKDALQSIKNSKNNEITKLRKDAEQLKKDMEKYQRQAKTNLDEAQRLRREDQVKEQNEANQAKKAMDTAKAKLDAEEKKDIQAKASSKGVEGEMAANKDNRNFYEQRITKAKTEMAGYGAEIGRYKTSIADLQASLTEYKTEQAKNGYPVDAAVVNMMLATIQEAEQKVTEIENNIKKCEVLVKDSETSITNIDASINEVRAINGMRDSSNFTAIEDLTDVSAAFKQYDKAKNMDAEINNNLNNAINMKNSCSKTFGTEKASLNSQLSELSSLQGQVPDSDKVAVGKKMLEIRAKLTEMDKTEKELDEAIKNLQTKKNISQANLQKAEKTYNEAVKTAERENEVLKSAYSDAALDARYQVTGKNTNTFNGCIATNMHDSELKELSRTAGNINDYQKILSDESVDKNSAEYANALTEQNRAMNGFFEGKNQYLNNVETTTQAVGEVRDTIDTVVTTGLSFVPVVGSALSTGYSTGVNLVNNYEDAMSSGVMSKSDLNNIGVSAAKDVATGAVSKVSGDVIGKFTGMVPKLGGKVAPAAQQVLLNGVNNAGANYISSFVSDYPGLEPDVKHELQRLGDSLKGAAPALVVDVLKEAFMAVV